MPVYSPQPNPRSNCANMVDVSLPHKTRAQVAAGFPSSRTNMENMYTFAASNIHAHTYPPTHIHPPTHTHTFTRLLRLIRFRTRTRSPSGGVGCIIIRLVGLGVPRGSSSSSGCSTQSGHIARPYSLGTNPETPFTRRHDLITLVRGVRRGSSDDVLDFSTCCFPTQFSGVRYIDFPLLRLRFDDVRVFCFSHIHTCVLSVQNNKRTQHGGWVARPSSRSSSSSSWCVG